MRLVRMSKITKYYSTVVQKLFEKVSCPIRMCNLRQSRSNWLTLDYTLRLV